MTQQFKLGDRVNTIYDPSIQPDYYEWMLGRQRWAENAMNEPRYISQYADTYSPFGKTDKLVLVCRNKGSTGMGYWIPTACCTLANADDVLLAALTAPVAQTDPLPPIIQEREDFRRMVRSVLEQRQSLRKLIGDF